MLWIIDILEVIGTRLPESGTVEYPTLTAIRDENESQKKVNI